MFAICELLSLHVELTVSTGMGLPHVGRYPRTSGTERSVGVKLLSYPAARVVGVSMSALVVWRLADAERGTRRQFG